MWLITTQGFYSVVAHREDPDTLLIRCRLREDLEALRAQLGDDFGDRIWYDGKADYPWRAGVSPEEWAGACAGLAIAVDYGNFKDRVVARHGYRRYSIYTRVWAALRELEWWWGDEEDEEEDEWEPVIRRQGLRPINFRWLLGRRRR